MSDQASDATAGERLDELERALFKQLKIIQDEHLRLARPIIERIAQIRAMRPPAPVLLDHMAMRAMTTPAVKPDNDAK